MMEEVLMWAKNSCFAAVGCAIISFLLPKGQAAKTAKVMIGIFLIWVMFTPIAQMIQNDVTENMSIDFSDEQERGLSEQTVAYIENQAAYTLQKLLDENKIEYREVTVHCNIEADGCININSIKIVAGGDVQTITELIEKETGLIPVVETE